MVKIRLARTGRRNRPFFRIVVVQDRAQRDGRYIENIGTYDPRGEQPEEKVRIEVDRFQYWRSVGAQPSEALQRLLTHTRALEPKTAEAAPAAAAPKAPAKAKRKRPAKKPKKTSSR